MLKNISHNNQKKIALINDFTGFGRCSIAVELPIISTLKVQCCPLPTSIFSNHTGFDSYFFDDYTDRMEGYVEEWKKLDLSFNGICSGFLGSARQISIVKDFIKEFKTDDTIVVVDPVMVATSGAKLISDDAIDTLKESLFPLAAVLTPNIPEAEVLSGMEIKSADDMITAAKYISETYHCAVLCKGGHQLNDANDLLYRDGGYRWFNGKRIHNSNTHGTGCTLSSAIASNLAKGYDLDTAVERAKAYISGALGAMLDLGKGSGPMDHGFDFRGKGFAEERV
mgnify:CR=1 FL=1